MAKMNRDERNTNHLGNARTPTMMQREMISSGIWCCCLNCGNFSPSTGCNLSSPVMMPPPDIIVVGCIAWTDDIPF